MLGQASVLKPFAFRPLLLVQGFRVSQRGPLRSFWPVHSPLAPKSSLAPPVVTAVGSCGVQTGAAASFQRTPRVRSRLAALYEGAFLGTCDKGQTVTVLGGHILGAADLVRPPR